jgi:hypothetical protein
MKEGPQGCSYGIEARRSQKPNATGKQETMKHQANTGQDEPQTVPSKRLEQL